ncbi:hypothetical protein FOZ61_010485 [Perkinsus olseni]|uniref:Protein ENHANCED DISEASE RESISTANCE 2 C-terminal domain-containing protein n=1 Tax=Perkinsus olseni TaxID=32597 RepID=A0A7J6M2S9_PEROL|nr:hypothetical protein FOZ61_010485 [Perkinsus olseni]
MTSCGCCALCQKVSVSASYRFDKRRRSTDSGLWEDADVSSPASSHRRSSLGSAAAYHSVFSVGILPRPGSFADPKDITLIPRDFGTPLSRAVSEVSYVTAEQTGDSQRWIPAPDPLLTISHNMGTSLPLHLPDTPYVTTAWSTRDACHFSVRCGPDYARTGNKEPSLPALYEPIGADLLRGDDILSDVARHMNFPTPPPWYTAQCRAPALLVVNAQVPGEGPSFNPFAAQKPDPGYSLIVYFVITREMASWSSRPNDTDVPASVRLWLNLLDRGVSDRSLPFKVIGRVQNLTSLPNLPALSIIEKYNGKPALITGSATILEGTRPYRYVEIDYDVRKWSLVARTTLSQVKDRFRDVVLDVGYLVESQEEEDMPERLLGSISLHHLDHNAAHLWVCPAMLASPSLSPIRSGRDEHGRRRASSTPPTLSPNTFRRKSTGWSSSVSAGEDNTDDDCNGGCQKDQLSYESEGRIRHDLDSVGASSCSAEAWLASLTADEHGGALPSLSASTLAATNTAAEGRAVGLLERLRQWGTVGEFLANDVLAPWSTLDQLSADYAVTSWFLRAPRISPEAMSPQWHCCSHPSAPYSVVVSPKGEVTLIDRSQHKVFSLALPRKTPRLTGSCVAFAPSPCPLTIALGTVSGFIVTSLSGIHEDWQITANRSLPLAPSVIEYSPRDGSLLAVGYSNVVLVWESATVGTSAATPLVLRRLRTAEVTSMAWCSAKSCSDLLAVRYANGEIRTWDVSTGECCTVVQATSGRVNSSTGRLHWPLDSERLYVSSGNRLAELIWPRLDEGEGKWGVGSASWVFGGQTPTLPKVYDFSGDLISATYSALCPSTGQRLAVSDGGSEVRVYEVLPPLSQVIEGQGASNVDLLGTVPAPRQGLRVAALDFAPVRESDLSSDLSAAACSVTTRLVIVWVEEAGQESTKLLQVVPMAFPAVTRMLKPSRSLSADVTRSVPSNAPLGPEVAGGEDYDAAYEPSPLWSLPDQRLASSSSFYSLRAPSLGG